MARIPYPDPTTSSARVTERLAALPPLNIFRMLAHAETAFEPFLRFGGAILSRLELDPALRELAILQVAKQTGADYEWVQHVQIARYAGLSDTQIQAVARGAVDGEEALDQPQRAVLAFTSEVIDQPRVSDEAFGSLSRHLAPREIVELMLTIGNYLMLARIMTTLEIELDEAVGNEVVRATRQPTD